MEELVVLHETKYELYTKQLMVYFKIYFKKVY